MTLSLVRMRFSAAAAKIETTPGTDAIAGTPASTDWIAGDFQVEQPHGLDVIDELGGQPGEVDLVNINLLLSYQIKEQIERAFEDLEFYRIIGHYGRRIPFAGNADIRTAPRRMAIAETGTTRAVRDCESLALQEVLELARCRTYSGFALPLCEPTPGLIREAAG